MGGSQFRRPGFNERVCFRIVSDSRESVFMLLADQNTQAWK